jgi:CBS domain-containing protein
MSWHSPEIASFLAATQPYASLVADDRTQLSAHMIASRAARGDTIFSVGDTLAGVYVIAEGEIELRTPDGAVLSILGIGDSFGARGFMREGLAIAEACVLTDSLLFLIPSPQFRALIDAHPSIARFFERSRQLGGSDGGPPAALAATAVAELMTHRPLTCSPTAPIRGVAALMRDNRISSVLVLDGERLVGIVTASDLTNRALAEGLPTDTPVSAVMTANPVTLDHSAIGADALNEMLERSIGHLPVMRRGRLAGIVSQTDLTRFQAMLSADLIADIVGSEDVASIAKVVARIPDLLAQLVAVGHRHDIVTRMITDVGDAATRRLLRLAEAELGPPPIPYLWLACGSQGRQEQTGISDQDNCLIIADAGRDRHDTYFAALARSVSDGLNACGYYYCPGQMMATNKRWRQPLSVWRSYFAGWIASPDPMAQMLASVMFDLRPIGGDLSLFGSLHTDTLRAASANSIFVSHMISNAIKHTPPLGLFRGFATIRSGEHKDTLDLKLNGVVPVVDLARIYALQGKLEQVNTRTRLEMAIEYGIISRSGGRDLLDAFDLIAETRLNHQAAQVRSGTRPDNFMSPMALSDLERSHLRDAFTVVKTMQAALGHGLGTLAN